jgi:hypothetical protein
MLIINMEKNNMDKVTTKWIGSDFHGDHFQVFVNNKKYPRERGLSYVLPLDKYCDENRARAKELALAERDGKFVSMGGFIYETKEDYLKKIGLA